MYNSNNDVYITGEIVDIPVFNHISHGENFYSANIRSYRLSGKADVIPVIIPEIFTDKLEAGTYVNIRGEFKSAKIGFIAKLYIMADTVNIISPNGDDEDEIYISGTIIKKYHLKEVASARKVISFILKVQRPYGDYSYIPMAAFGRTAMYVECMNIGTQVEAIGRVQSRTYRKYDDTDSYTEGTTYEVIAKELYKVEKGEETWQLEK